MSSYRAFLPFEKAQATFFRYVHDLSFKMESDSKSLKALKGCEGCVFSCLQEKHFSTWVEVDLHLPAFQTWKGYTAHVQSHLHRMKTQFYILCFPPTPFFVLTDKEPTFTRRKSWNFPRDSRVESIGRWGWVIKCRKFSLFFIFVVLFSPDSKFLFILVVFVRKCLRSDEFAWRVTDPLFSFPKRRLRYITSGVTTRLAAEGLGCIYLFCFRWFFFSHSFGS